MYIVIGKTALFAITSIPLKEVYLPHAQGFLYVVCSKHGHRIFTMPHIEKWTPILLLLTLSCFDDLLDQQDVLEVEACLFWLLGILPVLAPKAASLETFQSFECWDGSAQSFQDQVIRFLELRGLR